MKKLVSMILSVVMAMCIIFTTSIGAKAQTTATTFDFSQMTFNYERGTEYTLSDGKVNASFGGKYKEIQFKLPETLDMSMCKSVSFNANCTNGKTAFKLYDTEGNEVAVRYDFKNNGDCTFTPDSTAQVDVIGIMSMESYNFSVTVNKVTFNMGSLIDHDPVDKDRNLLTTYGKAFDVIGAGITAPKILNKTILDYTKEEHNAVTPGNELKPDAILGSSAASISVDEAKALGYNIPDGYTETTVPQLNFTTVDKLLKTCSENNMKMRGHTLVWHQQTPDWYFREGYTANGAYVSKDVMNKRMEFYIKTVMEHIHSSKYGDVLYAWDVANEYLNGVNSGSGWQQIYGSNLGTQAGFIKTAFEYAYETLEKFNLQGKVKLFYNDYNTYMHINDVIGLINYINTDSKICDGIGMQSHLDTSFPSVASYKKALQAFVDAGFEVQITELDVTCNSLDTQAKYYGDLMAAIMDVKKNGGNITALILWGLTDEDSWRSSRKPLLYTDYSTPKAAYESVLQAYEKSGYVPPVKVIPGDVNDDKKVNAVDFILLKKYLASDKTKIVVNKDNADVDGNGTVNVLDLVALKKLIQ